MSESDEDLLFDREVDDDAMLSVPPDSGGIAFDEFQHDKSSMSTVDVGTLRKLGVGRSLPKNASQATHSIPGVDDEEDDEAEDSDSKSDSTESEDSEDDYEADELTYEQQMALEEHIRLHCDNDLPVTHDAEPEYNPGDWVNDDNQLLFAQVPWTVMMSWVEDYLLSCHEAVTKNKPNMPRKYPMEGMSKSKKDEFRVKCKSFYFVEGQLFKKHTVYKVSTDSHESKYIDLLVALHEVVF